MYMAPLTERGPRAARGALWDISGVPNAGSGGSLEVKTLVFGKSIRETPAFCMLGRPSRERCEVNWLNRDWRSGQFFRNIRNEEGGAVSIQIGGRYIPRRGPWAPRGALWDRSGVSCGVRWRVGSENIICRCPEIFINFLQGSFVGDM